MYTLHALTISILKYWFSTVCVFCMYTYTPISGNRFGQRSVSFMAPSHLWLPVARGFTSFHNSHLQKDIGLQTSVTLDYRHAALELQSQKRITAFSHSRHDNVYFPFPPYITGQICFAQNYTKLDSFCSVYPPMCTCVVHTISCSVVLGILKKNTDYDSSLSSKFTICKI